MRIAFNKPDEVLPLYCDRIGYHWQQPPIHRLNGYYAYHWLQTETGTGTVNVAGHQLTLAPNQGILFRPRIPHHYYPKNNGDWQTAFLTFNGTICDSLADFLGMKEFLLIDSLSPDLTTFISKTFNEFKGSNIVSILDQSVKLYRFIMLLKENQQLKSHSYHDQQIVLPIIQYISKHYADAISNKQLSKITKYSVTYQNRVFKRLYNMTPLEYLNNYRMKKAKVVLLTHPNWEIGKVGTKVGFHDTSHFIYQFKRFFNVTPNQFKRSN